MYSKKLQKELNKNPFLKCGLKAINKTYIPKEFKKMFSKQTYKFCKEINL